MATITSVQSGNWSVTTTWDTGTVPVDGDSVVIASGHEVVFNVDQSGFATGLAGLTINGTLKFTVTANTVLKMAANIYGSGSLYVGNSDADPIQNAYTVQIKFNGAYYIDNTLATLEFHGRIRTNFRSRLSADYVSGTTTMILKDDIDLEANDKVSLSTPTAGVNAELLTVSSYTSGTKTVVFTTGVTNNHEEDDVIILLTKNIILENIHASSKSKAIIKNNAVIKGVILKGFNPGPVNANNCEIIFCTGQNNTYGGIAHYGFGHTIQNCTGQNNTHGGIAYYGSGHTIQNCTGQNNTYGGIAHNGSGHTIQNCTGQNNTHGGIAHNGFGLTIQNCTGQNNTYGGIAHYGSGHTIQNCTGQNNTYGGIAHYGFGLTIQNCTGQNNTYGGIAHYGSGHTIQNTHGLNNPQGDLYNVQSAKLFYCKLDSTIQFNGYQDNSRLESHVVEAFDLGEVLGFYRAWLRGGRILSDYDVKTEGHSQSLKFLLESANFAVHRSFFMYYPRKRTIELTVWVRKDASQTYLPRIQVIDPKNDPFHISEATPLAEKIMDNINNVWQRLKISYKSDRSQPLIVRVIAKGASGNVWFDVDDIERVIGKINTSTLPPRYPLSLVNPYPE